MTVQTSWHRIETWLRANVPEALEELQGPASAGSFERVVAAVGDLPVEYRELMELHDGVAASECGLGVFEGFVLYSLDSALRARDVMLEVWRGNAGQFDVDGDMVPDAGVRKCWWHEHWLPIAVSSDDSRTTIFLDLAPAPGGRHGQLVRHVVDVDRLRVVAVSVSAWLERVARALEDGLVAVEREDDTVLLTWPRRQT